MIYEDNRVTKWLHSKEKLWLLEESIRIERVTGDACVIESRTTPKGEKLLALYRVPEKMSEIDVYYPCGCIVYVEDPTKGLHLCEYHETKPGQIGCG